MLPDLSALAPLVDLGAFAVLVAVIFLLIRTVSQGGWVPKRELDYLREDRDAQLADRDRQIAEWRSAWQTSEASREILNNNNRELIEAVRDQTSFYDAFRRVLGADEQGNSDA